MMCFLGGFMCVVFVVVWRDCLLNIFFEWCVDVLLYDEIVVDG